MISSGLFVLAITLYLVSMVSALILALFSKLISFRFINTIIIFHLLTFIGWLIFRFTETPGENPGNANYFFLTYFCSGILAAGLIIRRTYPLYLKIYFTAFLASVLIFIVSPSRVIGFVSSGNINAISPQRINISENYFFVEQQNNASEKFKAFKLIREMGMFHKTLARDIQLPVTTDSVKLLNLVDDQQMLVQIFCPDSSYNMNITFKSSASDPNKITKKIQ